MADHIDLGKEGEALARQLLVQKAYEILEENYRFGKAEIDIIARKDGILVFIEVKTRREGSLLKPQEAVGKKKQQLMAQTAGFYAEKINHNWEVRFDVIAVSYWNGKAKIQHFEDAFFPNWG